MLNMNELRYLAVKSAERQHIYPGSFKDVVDQVAADQAISAALPAPAPKEVPPVIEPSGYGRSLGVGAGAGALAGIPVALLAHALMAGKDKHGLRDYLKSGLLGALLGGGVGAAGGAGLRKYMMSNPGELEGKIEGLKKYHYPPTNATLPSEPATKDTGIEADSLSNKGLNALLASLGYING